MFINIRSYAKINLVIDILGKRENGYHDVDMIMQKINLYDDILIEKIKNGIKIETNIPYLPTDSKNIMYKAAILMKEKFDIKDGIHMKLVKNIPVSAGLGGGSSNAAAVIQAMDEMFKLGLTRNEMMKISEPLGSDVPFCFVSGAARAKGFGEIITSIKGLKNVLIVVTKPNISVSTRRIYNNLLPSNYKEHPDVEGMIEALKNENVYEVAGKLGNVLESVTLKMYPIVGLNKKMMKSYGAIGTLMSGSGPSIYGLFVRDDQAKAAYQNLKKINIQTYLVRSYDKEINNG